MLASVSGRAQWDSIKQPHGTRRALPGLGRGSLTTVSRFVLDLGARVFDRPHPD